MGKNSSLAQRRQARTQIRTIDNVGIQTRTRANPKPRKHIRPRTNLAYAYPPKSGPSTASSKTFYSTASSHWCPRQQAHIKKEWKKRLKGNSNAGNSNANNARRVERNEERKKRLRELGQRDLDARIAREAVKTQNEKSPVASDHKNRESYCLLDKNMKYSP